MLQWRKVYFSDKTSELRVHLHVRKAGRRNQRYALLFRDYLRADDRARDAYGRTKSAIAAQANQDRLVRHDKAIFIDRHIGRRVDSNHAGHGSRFLQIDGNHACMRLTAKEDLAVQQILWGNVAGIERVARNLTGSVNAMQRLRS